MSQKLSEFFLPLIGFLLVAYWFLGANLFRGEIVAPMDLSLQYPGWKESGLSLPLFNAERSDIIDWLLPRWIFMKEAIWAGHLPLWNPLPGGGEPAFPLLSNGYLSPRFLLFLLFDHGVGFTLGLLVQLALAGLGTYLLCRLELGRIASLFGGVTYMMCGFNASWMMWPHVSTSMWIPWMLWAFLRVAAEISPRRIAMLSVTVAALLFGGFPSVAAYSFYAAALLLLWVLGERIINGQTLRENVRLILGLLGGGILGVALTGLQLIPFAEYLSQLDLSYRAPGGLPLKYTIFLLAPFYNGQPRVETTGYVGLLGLLLATVAFVFALRRQSRWPLLSPYFWVFLSALTLIAVYQTPEFLAKYFNKLPVLNFNSSSRMLCLFGLEVAVLSAIGLQGLLMFVQGKAARRGFPEQHLRIVVATIGTGLIVVQVFDIARVGRAQNVVVPKATFLPETPAIRYVKERIKPGQSVLATNDSYMIPGSLGSYGLSEWFAIGLATGREKTAFDKVTKETWGSAKGPRLSYRQVDFQSPWINALGIRYVLTYRLSFLSQEGNDHPSPPMPVHALGQTVKLHQPTMLNAVEVLLATYGRPSAGSDVWLKWFDHQDELLAETQVTGTAVPDNSWVSFPFARPLKLPAGSYRFQLGLRNPRTDQPVTAWSWNSSDQFQDGEQTIDGEKVKGDLAFRLIGDPQDTQKAQEGWIATVPGKYVTVLERQVTPPGAYVLQVESFLEEPQSHRMRWDGVKLVDYSSDHQIYQVHSDEPVWFVRTSRFWQDWEASVNRAPVTTHTYFGLLPAVKLDPGYSIVEWHYKPQSWQIGLAMSIGASVVLLGLFLLPKSAQERRLPINETREMRLNVLSK